MGHSNDLLKTVGLIVVIVVLVGIVAELVRSVPDPDLWSQESAGLIVAILAGAIAAVAVGARGADRR